MIDDGCFVVAGASALVVDDLRHSSIINAKRQLFCAGANEDNGNGTAEDLNVEPE